MAVRIKGITIPEQGILNFHMTDGKEKTLTWVSTAKKDSWTEEARNKASTYRRNHAIKRDDVSCFTAKLMNYAVCYAKILLYSYRMRKH